MTLLRKIRKLLFEFSDQLDLLKSEYTDHRHNKLLRHCTIMAEEVGGLAEALENQEAAGIAEFELPADVDASDYDTAAIDPEREDRDNT